MHCVCVCVFVKKICTLLMCAHWSGVCVLVVGQLTHTEPELYPLYVLHRKCVHSSRLCFAAEFEQESITSFPGKGSEWHERRGKEKFYKYCLLNYSIIKNTKHY